MLDLRVLGPLGVNNSGAALWLGAPKQQSVLALLAVQANQVVEIDELVDELWPDRDPPASAVVNVRGYAATLRRQFHTAEGTRDRISRCGSGYQLHAETEELDLLAFTEDCRRGRIEAERGDLSAAVAALSDALARWSGPMLAGLRHGPVLAAKCAAFEAQRITIFEHAMELHLAMGKPDQVIAALHEHVLTHPLREGPHALLIRALHQVGDVGGALKAYATVRQTLVEELGLEPGPELQELHREVLNRKPATAGYATRPDRFPARPRELPPDLGYFVGRHEEAGQVITVMAGGQRARRRPMVAIVSGSGGVGKSALAVHIGHLVADRYADGQLYVDLQGSSPGLRPLAPVDALRRLLRSLGFPPDQIPNDEATAAGRFRTATADGNFLLVLDNASGAHQVLPLLPSSGQCSVIITARQPLASLDADAHVHLGAFRPAEAVTLLLHMVGDLVLDHSTAEKLTNLCENLPLAVRIVAGRLLSRPDLSPTDLTRRLMDRERRLDELELDGVAVRSCVRVGYDAVASGEGGSDQLAAQSFRALGLLSVPDVQPAVIAAMLDEPDVDSVGSALNRLVSAQLLTANGPRYRLHDLVRLVAGEQAAVEDDPETAGRRLHRGLAYYAATLRRAEEALRPGRTWVPASLEIPPDFAVTDFSDHAQAVTWVEEELSNAIAAAEQASRLGGTARRLVLWLVGGLQPILFIRHEWHTQHRLAALALEAVDCSPDPEVRGWVHLVVGRSESDLGNGAEALDHFHRGLALLKQASSVRGVAFALNALGIAAMNHVRDTNVAMAQFTECLEHSRSHGLAAQEANVLHNLGNMCVSVGRWETAQGHLEQSLGIWRQRQDNDGLARVLSVLAVVHCYRGNLDDALRCTADALTHAQKSGDRRRKCNALLVGSEVYLRQHKHDLAWARAEAAAALGRDCPYVYGEAAALRQKAKITASLGRQAEAAEIHARAGEAFARLSSPPDPVFESVLAG